MLPNNFVIVFAALYCSLHKALGYEYDTGYFQTSLDHFSFAVNKTLKVRYLYNDKSWKRNESGPIFFYTGNEGNIESFAKNTGLMWEIAEEFGALIVFAEHRFYGKSFPNGFSLSKSIDNSVIGYLTVEQTLADFASLITWLKKSLGAESSPVIAFGGSYGGQLTAYLRIKYPHIVQGGIASSAPLFLTGSQCELHDSHLASVFTAESPDCVKLIRKSWTSINNITSTENGKRWLTNHWQLCDPLDTSENVTTVKGWLQIMYSFLGMANYPYPANFLQDLPAHPVKEFCNKIVASNVPDITSVDENLLMKLYEGITVYFNYSGTLMCLDYNNVGETNSGFSDMDSQSFSYQSCTELLDPACDNGVDDFFEPDPWDYDGFSNGCEQDFGVRPRPDSLEFFYGGRNLFHASNILFTNGLLDPWYQYGVLKNISDKVIAITIEDAAHHLDLRASNPSDPPSVINARNFEKLVIRLWIQEFHEYQKQLKIYHA